MADTELHLVIIEPATVTMRFIGPEINMAEYFTLILDGVVMCDMTYELFNRMSDDVVVNGSRSYVDGSMRLLEILMDVNNRVACKVLFKHFNLFDGWYGEELTSGFKEAKNKQ
ncbi:MAG: hypothetical protein R3F46_03295 [bacterium]